MDIYEYMEVGGHKCTPPECVMPVPETNNTCGVDITTGAADRLVEVDVEGGGGKGDPPGCRPTQTLGGMYNKEG